MHSFAWPGRETERQPLATQDPEDQRPLATVWRRSAASSITIQFVRWCRLAAV
jgi:hypothetical protein